MTGHWRRAVLLGFLIVGCAIVVAGIARRKAARHESERPNLLVLTSLPIIFNEGFSVQNNGSPALQALESRFRVLPISTTASTELARGRLLLMAQPLGQAPEDLVALDDWVRAGGRVLLFADPLLEWPSDRPLGDPLRPPPTFVDAGLLGHWGLRLEPPQTRGPQVGRLDGRAVTTNSAGTLSGRCAIERGGLVANCRIGKGRAIIVADADLLEAEGLGSAGADNLAAVIGSLESLAGDNQSQTDLSTGRTTKNG